MAQNGIARVLCVADDEDSCAMLKRYLESANPAFEVVGVGNAEDAQREVLGGKFDLYILDHWLNAEMGGVEFCRWPRWREQDVPIVYFSAVAQPAEWQKGIDAGAQEYLVKPNNLERLHLVVDSLLHRGDDTTTIGKKMAALDCCPGRRIWAISVPRSQGTGREGTDNICLCET